MKDNTRSYVSLGIIERSFSSVVWWYLLFKTSIVKFTCLMRSFRSFLSAFRMMFSALCPLILLLSFTLRGIISSWRHLKLKRKWFRKFAIFLAVCSSSLHNLRQSRPKLFLRYLWMNFLVACHMTKPIHNPLRSLMKARRLGRNVTKKLYGESSNWFTIYLYLTQLDDWEHS